jgi:pimeloyl-ACP methyl ester carboxylesterase
VDAHYGYYAARALFERMADDVIFSAHAAGYEQLWLAGISLGGFGATLYAAHHAQQIDGMILLAPYLGKESLIQEIEEAGGIQNWNPGDFPEGDTDRTLWAWFKTYSESNEGLPPIYLGYGKSDKFARANAMLAEILPPSHVFAIEGGHDWRTWKKIWRHFLTVWKIERH